MVSRILVVASIVIWLAGSLFLVAILWTDAHSTGPRDDVAAGMKGLGALVGLVAWFLSSAIGTVLAFLATRRARDPRLAQMALGANTFTLIAASVGIALLIR
jgi:hypothetical protein